MLFRLTIDRRARGSRRARTTRRDRKLAGAVALLGLGALCGWCVSYRRGRVVAPPADGDDQGTPLAPDLETAGPEPIAAGVRGRASKASREAEPSAAPEPLRVALMTHTGQPADLDVAARERDGVADPVSSWAPPEQGSCPEGTVEVEGDYQAVVGHICRERIDGPVERCAEYAAPPIVGGAVDHKRFCMDRFEYPNLEGVRPAIMVSWVEAKAACEAEGKRLCTASEWTLACEGSERLPYPYGYRRDSTACNIDRPHPNPDENALESPRGVSGEVARLDQRVASGEMERCTSPYGVHDMTGNVDEWVVNEKHFGPPPADGSERPFISALKGGYWGPVRNRCRATTTAHNESFRYYQVGFRCCADAP